MTRHVDIAYIVALRDCSDFKEVWIYRHQTVDNVECKIGYGFMKGVALCLDKLQLNTSHQIPKEKWLILKL